MSCSKDKPVKFEKAKIKHLCNKNLNSLNGKIDNLVAENVTAQTITTQNINTTSINGKSVNCDSSYYNYTTNLQPVSYDGETPIKPVNPGDFNQIVWDSLWEETLFTLNDILESERLPADINPVLFQIWLNM